MGKDHAVFHPHFLNLFFGNTHLWASPAVKSPLFTFHSRGPVPRFAGFAGLLFFLFYCRFYFRFWLPLLVAVLRGPVSPAITWPQSKIAVQAGIEGFDLAFQR